MFCKEWQVSTKGWKFGFQLLLTVIIITKRIIGFGQACVGYRVRLSTLRYMIARHLPVEGQGWWCSSCRGQAPSSLSSSCRQWATCIHPAGHAPKLDSDSGLCGPQTRKIIAESRSNGGQARPGSEFPLSHLDSWVMWYHRFGYDIIVWICDITLRYHDCDITVVM